MRTISAVLLGVTVVVGCIAACGGSNQNQAAQQPSASAYQYPQQGQYPPQQGQYPQQQPGYPPPGQQPGYPPQPGQPAAGGQLAVPGPMAFPCSSDSQCGTHKCNTQYGKCAHPCATDFDCIQGSSCVGAGQPLATCIPKPPGSP
jgi:hypothetical protein